MRDAFYIGQRQSEINVAEGKKQAQILASESNQIEQINHATGNPLCWPYF